MHEHTWLDYQDGGGLKCPCGVTKQQSEAEAAQMPGNLTQSSDQPETASSFSDTPVQTEQPAAETASVEGSDFTAPSENTSDFTAATEPAAPVEPVEPVEPTVEEAKATSLNDVAKSIVDEAIAKLTSLKEMF